MKKHEIERLMYHAPCTTCNGKRLKKEALAVRIGGKNIWDVCEMSIDDIFAFMDEIQTTFTTTEHLIADAIVKEINNRLGFLRNVGLNYLTLNRSSGTLSGGESQRIRLATQIGSALTGVLYILDEPEAALSPMRILELMAVIDELVKDGSQFIISTHSPMLMAFPDADVFQLGENGIEKVKYDETSHFILTKQFLENPERMFKYLFE